MKDIRFCAPCHFGLESILKFELGRIGAQDMTVSDGRISFSGSDEMIARANYRLASAERVLIELGTFRAETFEQLFQGVKNAPLERFIGRKDAFPVKGHSLDSKLHSIPDCQRIIKKAAVERLKSKYGVNWFEETGAVHQLQFVIRKDVCSLYLDTTGAGLHKRGYRRNSNDAPIKETLAAGIIDLARIRENSVVVDPMCGSGTFLIEAAYKALNIAPGLRRHFSAEQWEQFGGEIWKREKESALADVKRDTRFRGYGFDIDAEAVTLTNDNARKAGVISRVQAEKRGIAQYERVPGATVIVNPPYGERMLEIREAEELYRVMGEKLCPSKENPCFIISPHEEFETFFGRKADKKRKLYNGMIKCELFMYFK
ncbi:MAG: class I SAM-dependent RNA methyltransferase [Ruminococcus sp.]|nr:class I SAM-dependent RNA methyltransferase [Ruminococcus sp.]